MLKNEAKSIARVLQGGGRSATSLFYYRTNYNQTQNDYTVWVKYDGPRLVYTETSGKKHSLAPGMMNIPTVLAWRELKSILRLGTTET